jgi:hypothetical protein
MSPSIAGSAWPSNSARKAAWRVARSAPKRLAVVAALDDVLRDARKIETRLASDGGGLASREGGPSCPDA